MLTSRITIRMEIQVHKMATVTKKSKAIAAKRRSLPVTATQVPGRPVSQLCYIYI